jgi:hypothetical protein
MGGGRFGAGDARLWQDRDHARHPQPREQKTAAGGQQSSIDLLDPVQYAVAQSIESTTVG